MYKLYLEDNEVMQALCIVFCEAKPFWWRWFFGWRKTNSHGMYFRLTPKQHKFLMDWAYNIDEWENLEEKLEQVQNKLEFWKSR